MRETVSMEIGGRTLSLETGHLAKQAAGAVLARYGDTVVLATTVAEKEGNPERGFLPLTVDYREKMYAAGRIPGGFFKREGRPTEKEILSSRMTDRSLRPLFPDGTNFEIQVQIAVLSHDAENDSDVLGLLAASTAVNLALDAGQMSLHDVFLVHGSEANTSEHPRRGMTLRYMPTSSVYDRALAAEQFARMPVADHSQRTLYLMRGRDLSGRNDFQMRQ